MRRIMVALIVLVSTAAPAAARAGVIINQESTSSGPGPGGTETRTITVDGHKEKMAVDGRSVVMDLDKGKITIINPQAKTYIEVPFPPQGPLAAAAQHMGGINLSYKKTGGHQTLIGYACDEYEGSGQTPRGDITSKGCFSTAAPGSAEFSDFMKTAAAKMKGSQMATSATDFPPGIPLIDESTTK